MVWEEWKKELVKFAREIGEPYGPDGPIEACGEDTWRSWFDEGWTPKETMLEDLSHT